MTSLSNARCHVKLCHICSQDAERALIVRRRLKYLHARQRDYMSTYVLNTTIRRMGETPAWQPGNSRQRKGMRKILKASEARMQPKRCWGDSNKHLYPPYRLRSLKSDNTYTSSLNWIISNTGNTAIRYLGHLSKQRSIVNGIYTRDFYATI